MARGDRKVPPVRPKRTWERTYERELRKHIYRPFLEGLSDRIYQASDLLGTIKAIAAQPLPADSDIEAVSARHLNSLRAIHLRESVAKFRRVLGVDITPLLTRGVVADAMRQRIPVNVALIKTLCSKHKRQLRDKLIEYLRDRPFDREAVTQMLWKQGGVSGYSLRRIARDQTTKAIGYLTELRQTGAGVTRYEWSTSNDIRVRPTHVANSGQTFFWSDPPLETGHPGWDIQCRCVAIPLLSPDDRKDMVRQAEAYARKKATPISASTFVGGLRLRYLPQLQAAQKRVDDAAAEVDRISVKMKAAMAEYKDAIMRGHDGTVAGKRAHDRAILDAGKKHRSLMRARRKAVEKREGVRNQHHVALSGTIGKEFRPPKRLDKKSRPVAVIIDTKGGTQGIPSEIYERIGEALSWWERNMPVWPTGDDKFIKFVYLGRRSDSSWHDSSSGLIGLAHGSQADTVIHEMMHMYELAYIKQHKKSPHIDFLLRRSKGRKRTDSEGRVFGQGDFEDEYSGRVYTGKNSKRKEYGWYEGMPDSPWADPPGSEFIAGTETSSVIGQLVSAAANGELGKFRRASSLASTLLKDPDYLTFFLRHVQQWWPK